MINFHVNSLSFYLGTAHSQCLMVIGRDGSLGPLCHSCEFDCQQGGVKNISWPCLSLLRGWDSLTMKFPGNNFAYIYTINMLCISSSNKSSIYLYIDYIYKFLYIYIYIYIYIHTHIYIYIHKCICKIYIKYIYYISYVYMHYVVEI